MKLGLWQKALYDRESLPWTDVNNSKLGDITTKNINFLRIWHVSIASSTTD